MTKVTEKISTTQVAGIIGMLAVVYNTLAPILDWQIIDLNSEQANAIAGLIVMVLPYVWMMKERLKKSQLKWGLFK